MRMTSMTVRQRLENQLFNMGMFPAQASAVMDRVVADKATESMQGRWEESADEYPTPLYTVLWISVTDHALEWIDKNAPLAWYRPLFVRGVLDS